MRAEENLQLQEQVLRLRADVGRERVENASLTERLAQAETLVSREEVVPPNDSVRGVSALLVLYLEWGVVFSFLY